MGCTILTVDLVLQTVSTMNNIPLILEVVRDQLLLIGIFSKSQSPSPYKRNQSPSINQIADDLEEFFQVAFLDNTMTDEQFLDYYICFDVGRI